MQFRPLVIAHSVLHFSGVFTKWIHYMNLYATRYLLKPNFKVIFYIEAASIVELKLKMFC